MARLPREHCSLLGGRPGHRSHHQPLCCRSARPCPGSPPWSRARAALELTRDNAELLGLLDRLRLVHGRVDTDVELDLEDSYDLILQPPYIRKDLPKLSPQ